MILAEKDIGMVTEANEILPVIAHPLEPLTPEEIRTAVAIVRTECSLSERVRFVCVTLQEPGCGDEGASDRVC